MRTAIALALLFSAAACSRPAPERLQMQFSRAAAAGVSSTTREDLNRTIAEMRPRLAAGSSNTTAAVTLADALLRQTRVSGNAALAAEAERVLLAVLARDPDRYDARRMLAAVHLSEHRFRDALSDAGRCLTIRRDDEWVYGVIGDANIELGNYPEAFDAFDRMNATKPTAAGYARASYARELQGDLPGALRFMQMATEATTPRDVESLAWHHGQLGHLYLELGRLADAEREYSHANYVFPGHPFAIDGLARVAAASGAYPRALQFVQTRLQDRPLPADFALAGDLLAALGRGDEAERHYRLAEALWRSDVPEPSRLARFLAERGRSLEDAVRLAESAFADRRDIFTADALAWAYFQTGRIDRAQAAIKGALRTGTRDRIVLYHAAAIEHAAGHRDAAIHLAAQSLENAPRFDLIAAPAAAALARTIGQPQLALR